MPPADEEDAAILAALIRNLGIDEADAVARRIRESRALHDHYRFGNPETIALNKLTRDQKRKKRNQQP